MPKNNIEIQILGQSIKLYCPEDQQNELLRSAQILEKRVANLKDQSKIIQLEKVLTIIALNLQFELNQEKQKNEDVHDAVLTCLRKLDYSLGKIASSTKSGINIG